MNWYQVIIRDYESDMLGSSTAGKKSTSTFEHYERDCVRGYFDHRIKVIEDVYDVIKIVDENDRKTYVVCTDEYSCARLIDILFIKTQI